MKGEDVECEGVSLSYMRRTLWHSHEHRREKGLVCEGCGVCVPH